MAFESLSEKYEVVVQDFPSEWIPLTYLYDPDLPLFPLLYFHCLDPARNPSHRPGERDRVFGFVQRINVVGTELRATVALNKNLDNPAHARFREVVEAAVRNRLGLGNPVKLDDLRGAFHSDLAGANQLIKEVWYTVVDRSFGKSLPFGQMWDPVMGLARYIAR
jgi:hypothetical protein